MPLILKKQSKKDYINKKRQNLFIKQIQRKNKSKITE